VNVSEGEGEGSSEIYAPKGGTVTIDGIFAEGEWDKALNIDLSSGELLLMHDGGYLYVGIRSESLGLGSICVFWEDMISVLHSSAALGTAEYEPTDQDWQKIRNFDWTNRDTSNSERALEGRAEHLEREGWLASNGLMGNANEMEYQILMTEGRVHLAVTYLLSPEYETTDYWPQSLGPGCRDFEPMPGDPPDMASFSPETWITVIAADE
jgi:hypothetical protein